MGLRCLFGVYNWEKLRGLENLHNGKFMQRYICKDCKRMKEVIK